MWISLKRYDTLWGEKHQLQKDRDVLIRILSGVVVAKRGEITISMPSTDSRTLTWEDNKDGTLTIKSEVYNLEKGELSTIRRYKK